MKKYIKLLSIFALTFVGATTAFAADPVITSGNTANAAENQTSVMTVTATDADGDPITYGIVGGADNALFSIDGASGVLTFQAAPDFETMADDNTDGVYEVMVQASDGGTVDTMNISVTVDDVDEAPSLGNANIGSRDEDLAVGTTLYNVNEFNTGNDNDQDGDAITYAITGGNTDNVFAIDSATGVITLAASLDYETTSSYHLTFSGTSTTGANAALVGNGSMNMTVNDVDEDPVFTSSGFVSVAENTTAVTTVTATDEDRPAQTLTYSLSAVNPDGPDSDQFTIDANTGELSFITAPDYENPTDRFGFRITEHDNRYYIKIKVSDGTGMTFQNMVITVTDVLESTGHSRRAHSSHSADKVCKDSKATNFSNVGQHDQSLCKYAEEQKEEVKKEVRETVKEIVKETKEEVSKKCSVVTETKSLLRFGSKGQAVKDLQQYLNDNGFNAGTVDGIFGKLTKAAVKRMQAALGVTVDGIVGNQTRGKMSCK